MDKAIRSGNKAPRLTLCHVLGRTTSTPRTKRVCNLNIHRQSAQQTHPPVFQTGLALTKAIADIRKPESRYYPLVTSNTTFRLQLVISRVNRHFTPRTGRMTDASAKTTHPTAICPRNEHPLASRCYSCWLLTISGDRKKVSPTEGGARRSGRQRR